MSINDQQQGGERVSRKVKHFDDGRGSVCGTYIGYQVTRASKDVREVTCKKCIAKLREQFAGLKELLEMVKLK